MHAPTGGVLSPRTTASATSATSGAPAGSAAVAGERGAGDQRAGQQDRRLPAAIDEPAEQRAADAERHREGARDDAGGGERAGQVSHVDEQRRC